VTDYPLEHRTVGHVLADKARRHGGRPFLTFEGERVSYEALHVRTNRLANGLARLGVGKGDHVALLLDNTADLLLLELALGKLGAVAVPVNAAARGDLLRYFLTQSASSLVVVDAEFVDRIRELGDGLPAVRAVVVRGGDDGGRRAPGGQRAIPVDESGLRAVEGKPTVPLRELAADSDATPTHTVHFHDPHYILYTSGTTGRSKGVMVCQAHGFGVAEVFSRHVPLAPSDVFYTCLPLFHANAIWNTCYTALWNDASVALSRRFSASRLWDEIRAAGATQFTALGSMIHLIWNQPARPDDAENPVRLCFTVPTPPAFIREFEARFQLGVVTWFSMTENFPITLYVPGDPPEKMASIGRPRGDADVRVVDDDDVEVPPGEVGELVFRPAEPWRVMLGYYELDAATLANNRNLWFHTGDRVRADEDGWLWYVDRKKDSIRRRGENISAWELESIIGQHPAVSAVAAIAVPSEMAEDEVMVYVVPRDGERLTAEEIIRFCGGRMPYFMVPRYVDFIDELPRTPTEKVEKYKLRARARATLPRVWDRERAGMRISR